MIVNRIDLPSRRMAADGGTTWRCLARRGMLHSETESFDQLRLAPGAVLEHRADSGVEQALYVLAGTGEVTGDGGAREVAGGTLLLAPAAAPLTLRAGRDGLELIALRTLPARVSARLPRRVPDLPEAQRSPLFHPADPHPDLPDLPEGAP
ncbi:hypothetical protein ACFWXK_33625 [Streptomyces sp. NPDC059070]|uniref:hypothetical protein n=1 Tax=unclassified Streptomyces TaxID=2593676 RepID=UPI0034E1BFE7